MLLFEFGVLLVLDCFFLLEFDDVFETRSVSRGVRICLVFREGKESFQGSLALGWGLACMVGIWVHRQMWLASFWF
jgi:hypothetical protein